MKGLFLYNPADLNSKILGGVQICSQEFLKIIESTVDELHFFEVRYSRSLLFRLLFKLNLDSYQSYAPQKYTQALLQLLIDKQITHVFINKAELIKFSKLIKTAKLNFVPKVIVMSHGNESGDLLGDLTAIRPRFKKLKHFFGIIKLGRVLYLESWYRKRYVNLVCTMSEEESAIEKWLGINDPFFIPRLIDQTSLISSTPIKNVFGYVGTLSHTPNIAALYQLCEEITSAGVFPELRIVGQPARIGEALAKAYPFIKYLGPLSDTALVKEAANWSFFINPIFNYSRGASMKLAKAIEWELPIITTIAGRRGYLFDSDKLIETINTPTAMAQAIQIAAALSESEYQKWVTNVKFVKNNSVQAGELGKMLKTRLQHIKK